jgi:hypothetical protein
MRAILIGFVVTCLSSTAGQGASVTFTPHDVFHIPFGEARETLGTAVADGNFQYPRDFTLDGAGRVYIFDTQKHRVARFSADGTYEIGFAYPATARQVFAHADSHENLWLLISDPIHGLYYGVYDPAGKRLRDGIFSQYDHFRIYLDNDSVMHMILSSTQNRTPARTYIFHEPSLRMKKVDIALPPEDHHQLQKNDRTYFIDAVPGASGHGTPSVQRITDTSHRPVAQIKGDVIYITSAGEIYTRIGDCQINVYEPGGSLKGTVTLPGLPSACEAIRFDAAGTIYELDGIPDASQHYTPQMTGMRLLRWERQ